MNRISVLPFSLLVLLLGGCASEPARLILSAEQEAGGVTLVVRSADLAGRPAHGPDAGPAWVSIEGPLALAGTPWLEFGPDGVARVKLLEKGAGKARVEVLAADLPPASLEIPVGLAGGSQEALRVRMPLRVDPEG